MFKPSLPYPVLLGMMGRAKAHGPAIRRFEPDPAVSAGANVGTFNGNVEAPRHAAMMAPHPRAMARALPLRGELALPLDAIGKPHRLRLHQDEVRRRLIAGDRLVPANIGLARFLGWARWCKHSMAPL